MSVRAGQPKATAVTSSPGECRQRAQTPAAGRDVAGEDLPREPVLYVDDERYRRLWSLLKESRAHSGCADAVTSDELARVLYHEARLLDDKYYDEWLALFTAECLYWVPNRSDPGDPRLETGIYLDDRRRLLDRVAALRTGHLHAQNPPSRTRRMLTNIEQWTLSDGSFRARANVVIWESRKGRTRAYPGWQAYEVVRDDSGTLRLATKIVCLLDCEAPQGNYSFIL